MDCPKCKVNKMTYNEEWDSEFDRLDKSYPDFYSIRKELNRRGIPKYTCSNCGHKEFETL